MVAAAAEEAPRETTTGEAGCSTWNKPGHGHKASPHLGRRLSTSPELPGSRRDSGYQGSPLYPSGRGHRTSCSKDSPRQYEDKPPQYDRLRQDEDRPRQYYDKPRQYYDKPRQDEDRPSPSYSEVSYLPVFPPDELIGRISGGTFRPNSKRIVG